MKLRSFGKLFSLVAALALIFALTCAMTLTANAESIDALAADGDMTISVTAPYKECGKVKLSWDKVSGAYAYAVYYGEEHVANSVATYYSIGSLEVAAYGEDEILHSFKVVAIDRNGNELSFGTLVAPAKHNYNADVTEPTCTEGGYTTYTCACGDEYVGDYVDALGHDYGEWFEIVNPLCEVDGVLGHYTCSRCSLDFDAELEILESIVIPALGHSFTNHVYNNDSTCLLDGTKTATCDNGCGTTETLTAENTALGHKFENHAYNGDATCLLDGTKTASCANGCGETETLTAVDTALGHSFTNYVSNNDQTCVSDGSSTAVCDNGCGETDTVGVPGTATGHFDMEPVVENNVLPTCTETGSYDSVVYCSACGEVLSRETVTVDALGHTGGTPTCTLPANCDVCGVAYGEALGHTPAEVVKENELAPTCTETGSYDNVVYCSVCEAELSRETVTVDALGHTPAEAVKENELAPTCTETGSYDSVVYCSVCEVELSRENVTVDALGHTPAEATKEKVVPSTCLDSGNYDSVVYCSVCEVELSRENVTTDPLGHNFNNYKSDKNETCLADGTKTSKCSRCDVTDTKHNVGSALGHSFTNHVSNGDATCTYEGTKTATCDNGCGETETLADALLPHTPVLENNPTAWALYYYCLECAGERTYGKLQIPVAYRKPLLKGSVVLVALIIIISSIRALTRPATTTPWWKRRKY